MLFTTITPLLFNNILCCIRLGEHLWTCLFWKRTSISPQDSRKRKSL